MLKSEFYPVVTLRTESVSHENMHRCEAAQGNNQPIYVHQETLHQLAVFNSQVLETQTGSAFPRWSGDKPGSYSHNLSSACRW